MVARTREALQVILGRISEIDEIMAHTAASTRRQSASLEQVNHAIDEIDQLVQKNAAMVQETTSAAHLLAADTDSLDNLIKHFNIGREPAARAQNRTAARPAAAPAGIRRPHRTLAREVSSNR
jgi:methyl-accepting chemotaxis protein